jgi:hypothetical protein
MVGEEGSLQFVQYKRYKQREREKMYADSRTEKDAATAAADDDAVAAVEPRSTTATNTRRAAPTSRNNRL